MRSYHGLRCWGTQSSSADVQKKYALKPHALLPFGHGCYSRSEQVSAGKIAEIIAPQTEC
jgi:hypothetical protein